MYLTQLDIRQVRNLQDVKITPGQRCNYIYGDNASGKTSVLEAIYLLSIARSFRTTHIKHVITHDTPALQVFARIETLMLNLQLLVWKEPTIKHESESTDQM